MKNWKKGYVPSYTLDTKLYESQGQFGRSEEWKLGADTDKRPEDSHFMTELSQLQPDSKGEEWRVSLAIHSLSRS